MVGVEALIQRHQRLLAQGGEVGQQRIEAAFEFFRFEIDRAAEYTVVQHLQTAVEVFEAVVVLVGPALLIFRQACFEQRGSFDQLLAGVTDAAAQVAQLQTALQGELAGDDRCLADCSEASDPFDEIRRVLRGNLCQQIGFQPRCEGQAIVHDDLFAQRLQGAEGVGEAVVTVRPPTDAAQAF
ncbi:hypothetical protein PS681_04227 [Pseudomonas fluorescens]|nr:hypothetical protein PS681_04227 [Pseudomonas fluorescens]